MGSSSRDDLERIGLILAPVAALGAALLTPADVGRLLGPCPFHVLTGLPCPTCGVTRALVALAHGQWLEALRVQPLITVALVTGLLYVPWALGVVLRGWRPLRVELRGARGLPLRVAAIATILANWIYLVRAGV